jgi:hypothetical protein
MKTIGWVLLSLFLGFLYGCPHNIVFVSDRGGDDQIYSSALFYHSLYWVTLTSNSSQTEYLPDVSPDAEKMAFIRKNSSYELVVRNIGDTGALGNVLYSSANLIATPRWPCQQDVLAFAEHTSANHAAIFSIRADDPITTPVQVTNPAANQSDSGGHDFFENGNKIIFARSNSNGGTWDLYVTRSDGTGGEAQITNTAMINETLPVISHNQKYLAYLIYVPLTTGWMEMIALARVGEWAPFKQIQLQPPIGGSRISAIAFSGCDDKLYVAAVVPEVEAQPQNKKIELFEVTRILEASPEIHRLTHNTSKESRPDAIPRNPLPPCTRCAGIRSQSPAPESPELTVNGLRFKTAKLSNGAISGVSIEDYSYPRDGINEVKVGWSESDYGSAEFALIYFPPELYGPGPREVDVTAFHYNRCKLRAYNAEGTLLSEAQHTAGQRVNQTLRLAGGNISKIEVIGAELCIVDVCYRR